MRTAVVSGGTRGIGLAFSRRLVRLGFHVVALYRTDKAAAADAAEPGLVPVQLDVADPGAVAVVAADIVATHGRPSVLVNNAGVNVDRPVLRMSVEDWQRVIDTNLSGVFYLTRALLPAILEAPGERVIVNVGATTGIRPRRDGANYCASKAGLLQLTKCIALELAPRVRVNCLIPGNTETDELVARFGLDDPATRATFVADVPQGRVGTTEQVADALEFLVGPGSALMTGQKLIVDGGQYMW